MALATINSFRVDKVEGGYLAHGACSLGPVCRMGLTEQMAIHNAKQQVREYMRLHAAQRAVECRAKFPNFNVSAIAGRSGK
jgi:hypothetical protein